MLPSEVLSKLSSIGQVHLLAYWEALNNDQKKHLASQILNVDIDTYRSQKHMLEPTGNKPAASIGPLRECAHAAGDVALGQKLLSQKKCGCLLIAGGQGTRLRYDGPKGMFPVSVIKHKTLFQLFAEKTLAAGRQAGCLLPLAIMTSPLNHNSIAAHFEANSYFGLHPSQISFYSQNTLPFLNDTGDLFLDEKFSLAQGPDGNGSALKSFVDAGIWSAWRQLGVEQVHFVLVDNPLADPFDAELLGFHAAHKADITLKCAHRLDPEEKVGLVVEQEGHMAVIEYSEISQKESQARRPDGTLKYACANLSLFCLSMDFIRHAAYENFPNMPLHKAYKAVKYLDETGRSKMSEKPQAWKFERFIFDILPFADEVKVLVYPREICFAPLKNATGPDSLETVQAALQHFDKITYEKITRQAAPAYPFELSQDFHYPTPELLQKWQGQPAPAQGVYITP